MGLSSNDRWVNKKVTVLVMVQLDDGEDHLLKLEGEQNLAGYSVFPLPTPHEKSVITKIYWAEIQEGC